MSDDKMQRIGDIDKTAASEVDGEIVPWWLSFADPFLPKGQTFVGASVIKACGPATAMKLARELGCFPDVVSVQICRVTEGAIAEEHFNVLMDKEELLKHEYI